MSVSFLVTVHGLYAGYRAVTVNVRMVCIPTQSAGTRVNSTFCRELLYKEL